MKIGIRLNEVDEQYQSTLKSLEKQYNDVTVTFFKDSTCNINDFECLISSRLSKDELSSDTNLKTFIIPYTGVNQLPLKELGDLNITVMNCHAHAKFVAEKAFSLALSLLSRIPELHEQMKNGEWVGFNKTSEWTSIYKKRCGFIGMGQIGMHIVDYLKPFECEIITLKRYQEKTKELKHMTYYDTIEEVCLNAEIIFLSLPLTNETKNSINKNILNKMNGQYLINVGRGPLIEEEALYEALNKKKLKGAAIDVWYHYPKKEEGKVYPSKYPFHTLNNVIMSPHCAGHEESSKQYVLEELMDMLHHYIKTNQFKNKVDLNKQY